MNEQRLGCWLCGGREGGGKVEQAQGEGGQNHGEEKKMKLEKKTDWAGQRESRKKWRNKRKWSKT